MYIRDKNPCIFLIQCYFFERFPPLFPSTSLVFSPHPKFSTFHSGIIRFPSEPAASHQFYGSYQTLTIFLHFLRYSASVWRACFNFFGSRSKFYYHNLHDSSKLPLSWSEFSKIRSPSVLWTFSISISLLNQQLRWIFHNSWALTFR